MIKHFKRPLSIILAVLMVMSVFIAVPMTASALTEDDVESLLDSMRVVIYGYADQNDFDHVQALSNYYVPLSQAFEDANLQVTPEVESAYNAAYAYFYGGSGGQGGSGGFNGNYPNVNNVYMATDEVVEVTVSDLQSGDVLVKSSEPLEVQKGDCDIVLVGGTYGMGDVHEGILDQTYPNDVKLGNELHFDFMDNARITDEDNHGRYAPVYNNALGNAYIVLGNDNGTVYLAGYNFITYTITWKDYNGSNLYDGQSTVAAGTVPSYRWSVSRSSTAQYSYTFTGWTDSSNTFYSKDSDLPAVTQDETYTATYSQTLRSYTITWKDGDDKTLKSDSVAYGTTPSYTGATPTKTEDDNYTYEFNNTWSPSVASVTGNATYTAQFTAVPKPAPETASYLTFTAEEANSSVTLNVSTGSNLQYYKNNSGWQSYTAGAQITLASAGDSVRFRGKDTTFDYSNHVSIGGKVACSGNVMSLRLDDYGEVQGLSDRCFYYMFKDCAGLTAAPELPETILAENCYNRMFYGCTSLTTAPDLPATTLAESCYDNMFSGCTSLTTAPALPATSLARYCYNGMFYGCTSLTAAPELWATTLEYGCYSNMFSGCEKLTTAPELPATTLARYCYSYMFYYCKGLTTAPELPATELEENCYNNMFNGCRSLTTAPELPATTLVYSCYTYMFYGCSGIKLSETQTAEYNVPYSVPSGGNGTTADSYVLNSMFAGTGGTFTGTPTINKTYYMYREYDYTTTGNNGYYFDDTIEAGVGDILATLNGYSSLFNFKILGVQKKNDVDVLSTNNNDVRFVSVINTEILKDADEYGYVFAKFASKEDARAHCDEIQAYGDNVLTKECTTTSNTISGNYGLYNEDTNYKYVTATVNGIGDDVVAARFYIRKGNTYYYADYTNDQNQTYGVCAAAYSDLT